MAKTANTGFYFRKSLYGVDLPAAQQYIITASATLKVGDLCRIDTGGNVKRCASGEVPGGVVVGLVDFNGTSVFSPRAAGTTGATLTPDDQVAVSSTNVTDLTRQLSALVILDPAGACLWYNVADSALASTNLFQTFDVANGNQVTVGGASDTTSKEVQLISLDPDGDGDTTKGLFRINNSQFGVGIDAATTRVAA